MLTGCIGVGRRKIDSEELEKAGLLIEEQYKQHQLDDVTQLHHQANDYLSKSIKNINITTFKSHSLMKEPQTSSSSYRSVEERHEAGESPVESVGNSPIVMPRVDALNEDVTTSSSFQKLQTKVVLDIPASGATSPADVTPSSAPYRYEEKPAAAFHHYPNNRSDLYDFSGIPIPSIQTESEASVRLTVDENPERHESPDPLKLRPIRIVSYCCLAVHCTLSILCMLLFIAINKIEYRSYLRTFTIIYPFAIYIIFRVILVFVYEFILTDYARRRHIPLSLTIQTELGYNRKRILPAILNNLCLILTFMAAILPYGDFFGPFDDYGVKVMYIIFVFLIHLTSLAVAYLRFHRGGLYSKIIINGSRC